MFVFNRTVLATIGVTAAAVVSATFFAAPAQAATAGLAKVSGDSVYFNALMSKTNNLTITKSGKTVTLDDTVALKPGAGCKKVDTTKVRCTTKNAVKTIAVALGDKNDKVVNKTGVEMWAEGGAGNDKLLGGPGVDYLLGGAGNDSFEGGAGEDFLIGYAGNDALSGGLGDDYFDGGKGADTFKGGGGTFDHINYAARSTPVTADLDGAKNDDGEKGEKDSILHGVEAIYGGKGNDFLGGSAGDDQLVGGPGNDRIFGRAGNDALVGESLNDENEVVGSDAATDRIDGGDGVADQCYVLAAGRTSNCELPAETSPFQAFTAGALQRAPLASLGTVTAKLAAIEAHFASAGR
jgi:Ca2+-binding RTX toxin-like protein